MEYLTIEQAEELAGGLRMTAPIIIDYFAGGTDNFDDNRKMVAALMAAEGVPTQPPAPKE